MIPKAFTRGFLHTIVNLVLFSTVAFGQIQRDLVSGNLIQFNDNGVWCWYQDERAVVDTAGRRLMVGSVANNRGVGGSSRDGDIDVVFFDFQSRMSQRFTLAKGNSNFSGSDDHNAPAFLVRPDGKYLTGCTGTTTTTTPTTACTTAAFGDRNRCSIGVSSGPAASISRPPIPISFTSQQRAALTTSPEATTRARI